MNRIKLLMVFAGLIMISGCTTEDPDDPTKQPGNPTEFTVTPATIAAKATHGTYSINVTCNTAWSATSSADWCSLEKGDGTITVAVTENTATAPRTATITVTAGGIAETVTVTQEAATLALSETMEFTFTGNTITLGVTAQNMAVDWGDDTTNEYTGRVSPSHTYQNNIRHTVRIQAKELSYFNCNGQNLTALDVSGCTELTWLDCYGNQLTALDVSHNTKLGFLNCADNQLTALDVSHNTKLTTLLCSENQLTTLDVSHNTKVTELDCYGNQLAVAALNALFTSLPTVQSGDIYISHNPGTADCDRSIATAKGWIVLAD
jgi:Leucine-rich repeat (LRR) protein